MRHLGKYIAIISASMAISLTNANATTYLNEDFSWLSYGSALGWVTTGESNARIDKWTSTESAHGWKSRSNYVYARQGFLKLGKVGYAGDVITPSLGISGTTSITVSFQATGFTSEGLSVIDAQEMYVAAIGAGKVVKVTGGTGDNSVNGGETHYVANNVAYVDANGNNVTLNDVAYIKLDSANHFNNTIDPDGTRIWQKGFTHYTVTIDGATSATRVAFICGNYSTSIIDGYRNRMFLDNIVVDKNTEPNIAGRITCDGEGVAGVPVSDGVVVVATDNNGYYSMRSEKANGFVFYTLPGGYEPEVKDGFNPQFWAKLTESTYNLEEHNFTLKKVNNDTYIMVVAADAHLSTRTNDMSQFHSGFISRLNDEVNNAGATPIYSTILGDLAWDRFWYSKNYDLSSFMNTLVTENYPMIMFPVIGNHDNDGAIPAGTSCDFLASAAWRTHVCPHYYSYNLGQVHYVVLDNIVYLNTDTGESYDTGIVGSRNYNNQITDEQIAWLKKDLKFVDKSTPVVIEMHIPGWKVKAADFSVVDGLTGGNVNSSEALATALSNYENVLVWTGHTHYNCHAHPTSHTNIHENNVAAVCATWWWTGYYTGRHICKDGSPGGYEVVYVNGKDIKWEYHSMERNGNAQFRAFDMNKVRSYFANNANLQAFFAENTSKMNYASSTYDNFANSVMLNIFNYDTDWKVEAVEVLANGTLKTRTPVRIAAEDPLHTLAYTLARIEHNATPSISYFASLNAHMFRIPTSSASTTVNIKVTDSFGNIYTKEFKRPSEFSINMTDENVKISNPSFTEHATTDNAIKVLSGNGSVIIKSDFDTDAQIYSGSGNMVKSIKVKRGHNEYPIDSRGFYIVSIKGTGHKVVL
ncbi:MAG: calcineurin-like phosphoesterase family protein [Muribaculaceae bacterium]|nr:calcineurin-like phosphoesterase family protein [Muribaculaceae bacterium]